MNMNKGRNFFDVYVVVSICIQLDCISTIQMVGFLFTFHFRISSIKIEFSQSSLVLNVYTCNRRKKMNKSCSIVYGIRMMSAKKESSIHMISQYGRYIVYMERQPRQRRMSFFFLHFIFLENMSIQQVTVVVCSIGHKMGHFYY